MLLKEMGIGRIKGILVCKRAPQISHLLFADDSIIFCRAILDRVIKVLKYYKDVSGQKLNKEKTTLLLSKNTKRETQEAVKDLYGHKLYNAKNMLGCPLQLKVAGKKLLVELKTKWEER